MRGPVGSIDEDNVPSTYDLNLVWRMTKYARHYWHWVLLCVFMLLSLTAIDLALPYLSKTAIDSYITLGPPSSWNEYSLKRLDTDAKALLAKLARENKEQCQATESGYRLNRGLFANLKVREKSLLRRQDKAGLFRLVTIVVALLLLQVLFAVGQMYIINLVGEWAMYDLRNELFSHLQRMSPSFFDRNPVGRLVTRVANDINVIREFFTAVLATLFKDIFLLLGIVSMMFFLDKSLALVSLLVVPPLAFTTFYLGSKVRSAWRDIRRCLAQVNVFIQEHLSGIRIVQAFSRQAATLRRFDEGNDDHYEAACRQVSIFALYHPLVSFLASFGLALIYWYGGGRVMAATLSFGTLVAFVHYLEMFFRPIRDLSQKYNIVQSAMAASERVFALLDRDEKIDMSLVHDELSISSGDIEFKDVWFAYKGEQWVLKDLSFKVKAGESLALVGHTGAGKTSIINVLMRHYEFQRGQVTIDGKDIRTIPLGQLRKMMGCVRQDIFTFAGSIEDNIRLRTPGLTKEDVVKASGHANALRFINALPQKFSTDVQERGQVLSMGQRQLLSFARALVHKPKILLLDEATANIDTRTEQEIQSALSQLVDEFTSIVVAHRLSTVRHVDSIIVIHKGQLREHGTHEELMKAKDIYFRLYQLAAGA